MDNNDMNSLFWFNREKKDRETKIINNFKKIYNILRKYVELPCKYDQIITNEDIRIEFLLDSVRIVFENDDMDPYTRDVVLRMYEELYDYLYKDSELKEIEIPETVVDNIFNKIIIPSDIEIKLIVNLIKENRRIFKTDIEGKYFSQMLDQGLHNGITKELKIEEDNLSHLLGLTNEGSLYEFYRKVSLDREITKILNSMGFNSLLDSGLDIEEFNNRFRDRFGLDYSEENRIKIINWRYNALDEYLKKRGINVTDQERLALDKSYMYAPKSRTLDFYTKTETLNLLLSENNEIRKFIYEFLRADIILKSKSKNNVNELRKIFKKEELDILLDLNISNTKVVINLINRYMESKKYKLEEDKKFKSMFISKFGYSYPLVNYYELLSKNVSFYNFSLFKNLNSIIVDYDSAGKKIESDVFLVSYSQDKMGNIKEMIAKLIDDKDKKYEDAVNSSNVDSNLDRNYIMKKISLFSFPLGDRYYFSYGFLKKDKQKQDDKIVLDNTNKNHNITLIGFKTGEDEKKRLDFIENMNRKRIKHFLNCETNITSNYYQYVTDYIRNGIEYPLDILEERYELPYNGKRKILKIVKPIDKLSKYMLLFEVCKINIDKDFEMAKQIRDKIYNIIDNYQRMSLVKVNVMKYRMENRGILQEEMYDYRNKMENSMGESSRLIEQFNKYKEYIDNTINYYEGIKKRRK